MLLDRCLLHAKFIFQMKGNDSVQEKISLYIEKANK